MKHVRRTLEALISGAVIALSARPVIADDIYVSSDLQAEYNALQKERKHNGQTVDRDVEADVISASFVDVMAGNDDGHTDADETNKFLELSGDDNTFYAIVLGSKENASAGSAWPYTNNPMDYEFAAGIRRVFATREGVEKKIKEIERKNPALKEKLHFVQFSRDAANEPIRVVAYFERSLGRTIGGVKFPDFYERPVLGFKLKPRMAKQKGVEEEKYEEAPKEVAELKEKPSEKEVATLPKKPEEKVVKEEKPVESKEEKKDELEEVLDKDTLETVTEKPTQEEKPEKEKPEILQKDFRNVEGYFTVIRKGRKITVPTRQKVAEVTRHHPQLIEIFPERGFEYGGKKGTLDQIKAVYDMRHDKVRVAQDRDVYIVTPKLGDSILFIKLDGKSIEITYKGGNVEFGGGTVEELNEIAREADKKEDRILTGKELSILIYNTFQEWKARRPKIEAEQSKSDSVSESEEELESSKPKYEGKTAVIELKDGIPVDYSLEDFKGKKVYDTNDRPVLIKGNDLWVKAKHPSVKEPVYNRYEMIRSEDGKAFLRTTDIVHKEDAEKIGVAQELDRLEMEEILLFE